MDKLRELLEKYLTQELRQIVLSNVKGDKSLTKVKIRPVLLREQLFFQETSTKGNQEFHRNFDKQEMIEEILVLMEQQFTQLQLSAEDADGSALVSKKGRVTVKIRRHPKIKLQKERLSHNKKKQYVLPVGTPVDFLVDLGVMSSEGKIIHARYDKFRQINRFLEFVQDILPRLPKDREVTILDFGCGKSYLTFAMYYYLRVMKSYDIRIIGLDLKEDVIRHCNALSEKYGYDKLKFYVGDIADYQRDEPVDMVVTLHACDTATDYALYKAVRWSASVILSVPCCQHELNGQIKNEMLDPILSYGILKERMAALATDGIRAQLLEEQGYDTQILEFIDMEHTPKNLLIRAVRVDRPVRKNPALERTIEALHVNPTLKRLFDAEDGQ